MGVTERLKRKGQIGGMQLVIHEGASTDAPGPKKFRGDCRDCREFTQHQ